MYIESPQNSRIREWAKLKTKRGRDLDQAFLVEGMRLTKEVLESSLTVEQVLWDVGTDELPDSLLDRMRQRKVPLIEVSPAAFKVVSDTVTPQGVLAVVKIPEIHPVSEEAFAGAAHTLLLDGLQDPGNVGTLLRSAEAFGLDSVWMGTGTVDPYSPKVVRASMGGLFRLRVASVDSVKLILSWKERFPSGQVVVTAADGSLPCDAADLTKPCLFVLGSEAFGVSDAVVELADIRLRIPMTGLADSLNVAIAGSVLLYESLRQRRI